VHIERIGEKRNACRLLVGKPQIKRPLGRPRRGWKNNSIKIDLWEIEWGGVDWSVLCQDRYQRRTLVNTVMNIRVL
jgi:hypothetical protein